MVHTQHILGTAESLRRHIAAGSNPDVVLKVVAQRAAAANGRIGQKFDPVFNTVQQKGKPLAQVSQYQPERGNLVEQAGYHHAQQRGDRIHRKAKTGTGKGKAVACVAAALGELRVEIDVDAKFGGLAEEGEIAGIVRCGVSVIRVGVP